jgi:hypothetical protein
MFLPRSTPQLARRRGAILLIVLTLIALFSVVGLSFALYAEAEAVSARTRREAMAENDAIPSQERAASQFLSVMLYPSEGGGTYGTGNGTLNALRGHDFATMMYGNNAAGGNTIPYNGIGTVSEDLTANPLAAVTGITNRVQVVNYAWQYDRTTPANSRIFDPEYLGVRANTTAGPTTTYVSRAAGYTYPDRNNMAVAVQDSTTGRIIVPSFHRHNNFNALTTNANLRLAPPTVVPTNTDWTNAAGRYRLIRPRPADHNYDSGDGRGLVSDFPYPPQNPDGTWTGDVQNITQQDGLQYNDAVWVNPNLPEVLWRGKTLKPLIAATILPLDARINANVAGNRKGSTGGMMPVAAHGSTHGFGPWEINLSRITSDANTMVDARATLSGFNARGATGKTANPFATTVTPAASAVNWDAGVTTDPAGMPSQPRLNLPTGNQSDPTFGAIGATGFDFTTTGGATTESDRHPSLFNPYAWNAFTTPGRVTAHDDLRRSSAKYAGKASDYGVPFYGLTTVSTAPAAPAADTRLFGTGPTTPAMQSNRVRSLLTTASNSLARIGLQPNYTDYTTSNLSLVGGVLTATAQNLIHPPTLGVSSDFAAAANLRSAMATIGAVDLNRPLADYRAATNPTGSLSANNMANAGAAANDRQTMARDIFVRLIVATGAKANVTAGGTLVLPQPSTTTPGTYDLVAAGDTTQQQYDALRYLAQLAANITDYVDNDDINTTFVWNPQAASGLFVPDNGLTEMTTLFANPGTTQPQRQQYVQDRTVFGVEKPRVLMNEVYSEVTNAPGDSSNPEAMSDFHVRVWVELINPSNAGAEATAPMGNGTAPLTSTYTDTTTMMNTTWSAYKVQVFKTGSNVRQALFDPATPGVTGNVTGRVDGAATHVVDALLPTTATLTIEPNNGSTHTAMTPATGFRVLGPDLTGATATSAQEFIPNATTAPYTTGLISIPGGTTPPAPNAVPPSPTLAYQDTKQTPSNIGMNTITPLLDQAVVLRRLANPYLPANDPLDGTYNVALPVNPFITVDVFTDVPARDAIRVGERDPLTMNGMRPMGEPGAPGSRSSVGRMAPHYAHRSLPFNMADTAGFVAAQSGPNPADPLINPNGLQLNFFTHNTQRLGVSGMPAPTPTDIQWLTHLDRQLVNQTELTVAAAVKPHELTYRFVTGTSAAPAYHEHTARFYGTSAVPLYRALELLTVRPFGYGLPAEGRVPGKVNINMIWDKAVLEAVLDQNASNAFTTAEVDALWAVLQGSTDDTTAGGYAAHARTKNGATPGPTFDEVGATYTDAGGTVRGSDRPFKPLGTAAFSAASPPPTAPQFDLRPLGSGIADTILRDGATPGTPALLSASTATHPYQRAEMLRKLHNNVTYTTDTYLVVMTVGYFEVRNPGPYSPTNPPVLGKEVYDVVLGDMRGKFVSVVDRSMLGVDTTGQQADGLWQAPLGEQPYDPTAGTMMPLNVYYLRFPAQGTNAAGNQVHIHYEGRFINLTAGPAYLGVGQAAEQVTITALGGRNPDGSVAPAYDPVTGLATVTLAAGPTRLHSGGACVSNALSSNPGPQANFDVNAQRYKGVVPYFQQVEMGK